MEVGIEAARWVIGKALSPASGGVLEAWAASSELGANIRALRMELLYAQGMLNKTRGRGREEIQNPALAELLQELRDLAYSADDALDEVDYFRIQDELDGTYHAAEEHAGGCLRNHALNARHTAKGIGKMLGFSSHSRSASRGDGDEPNEDTRVCCGAWPYRGQRSPDNVQEEDASRRVLCGVSWPCGGQSTRETNSSSSQPPTNQADQEEAYCGCTQKLASGARNTINIVGKHLPCYSVSPVQNDANSNTASSGRRFLCCARPNKAPHTEHAIKAPKLKFNRVEMSKRMKDIVEQLKPVCAKVSTILNLELLDSNRNIAQCIAMSLDTMFSKKQGHAPLPTDKVAMNRPITTSELIEPKLYGRDVVTSKIIDDITKGQYCDKDLIVLPIVGPGGIGKTTLTQYIYKELQHHFEEKIWVCVSTTFNVYRLTQEIVNNLKIEKKNDSPEKLIEEKLKSKKFLIVLDDMWSCSDDEWRRFLVPFTKGQSKGNIILVTTRFPALAQMVKKTTDHPLDLEGLDPKAFRDLFLACVFGDKQLINVHSELLDIGEEIVEKLKGSPLAAKTVGRLLSKHLDLDHWTRVLESKEWELQNGEHDIMPALKLSYDYLPFHLQQCFSYCALFPEDYKFKTEELIHLWIGLDVLHSHGENKRIEDIGLSHLTELVNYGFFRKEEEDEYACYVIHDLLHELAQKVSSHECLSIYSYNVRSTQIPPSIRHLSINIDYTSVKDKMTFDTCTKDLSTLHKRLKVENLRSLMLFGSHQSSFVKTFDGLFKEAKALRVVFLKDFLHSFSELVHLRYLRIIRGDDTRILPNIISRFYHLRVLDIHECYYSSVPTRYMSNLVKLRHFFGRHNEMHSSILDVGKLKSLQELRRFVVKKESQGFELGQIGHLVELCGSLSINNLEKVEGKEEADEAKLIQKTHLRELILHWDSSRSNMDYALEEHVLESLKPNSNLVKLCITGHGGFTCPSWLGEKLSVKNLESLQLHSVSWENLPPLGELCLVDEHGKECPSYIQRQSFKSLKRLELVDILKLKKWVGNGPCELFSHLKVLIIKNCPKLMELPFSHHTGCESEHEANMTWFPKLEELKIEDCPKLSSLPCVPWSNTTCSAEIARVGSGLERLVYQNVSSTGHRLEVEKKGDVDSVFWTVLAFHNLSKLESLTVTRCPPLLLDHLQMLSSLKSLEISDSGDVFCLAEGDGHVRYEFPVEDITILNCGASGEGLTRLLSYFPKLQGFNVIKCEKLTGLGVAEQQKKTEAPARPPLSSINEVEEAQIGQHQQQQDERRDEEISPAVATTTGLLLLPPQLQWLEISCPNLVLCPDSLDDDKDTGRTGGGGGGLQGLSSLRSLWIFNCPRFLSSYLSSSSSSCCPFPNSLEVLDLNGVVGTKTLPPLSNLTSLTTLSICRGGDLRGDGLWPLLAQGHLTKLSVHKSPKFFAGSEPPRLHEQELPSRSSKLQELDTDDVAGVLAAPICILLSSSLTRLDFIGDEEVERFTKEQEEALQLLTSLQEIGFWNCNKLQCLPPGLHRLLNLKRLQISNCRAIRSLPKDGLPSSLQELKISYCRAIRSLPKVDNLPSSLRVLDVRYSESEELKRQCRKLIGTIPIVDT
ncbi:uncharacterized protein LOC133887942 isoform X2 [Phragmites australis]|uniref:uncharacterized protein LOC133887942 isoform X2 n=1 Tax=Phragmites australis TaxID=29695 RepID=UPI002D784028|nr:uncharacterized protein LOC133887942 isoform X2 [Phragmites australis]XP_062183964.1 uncharacterized protein LOC133887942 isoform X2 [Phragmites australis]XP_062183965.1 uncharacterized protein LOC133887942 isoform X2 [Phragmites australis]XP_062183966.1 uncharacterized protein LOC133887942 isoform X2 [Phragmites australis]XP_062183967.1 uncharacterized protein LOC133887942 isoform X2 [Phragmites australis]XP_062183968.1 uncharacterized protein LOC133887942 isoform X2 [Phragmites australis]